MSENDKLRQVLRDLLRLMEIAERCDRCCGPNFAFDLCHIKHWRILDARIRALLKSGLNKPN